MIKKIIHIPHTSKFIPDEYLGDYIISKEQIDRLNELYCDSYVDEVVDDIDSIDIIRFNYSRLFCDVERFNNNTEEMNQFGRGVLYTHDHNLNLIRNIKDNNSILKIYENYHEDFTKLIEKYIKNKVLIIDLHSYSIELLSHKEISETPNVCIGVDYFHYDKVILEHIFKLFKNENIIYKINHPYAGSIVPLKYYKKDNRVISIMLDFEKNYLKNNLKKINEILKCVIKI